MEKIKMKLLNGLIAKLFNWVKNNKFEFALLLIILFIGAFLRLYKIADYMTFLGDEGRDAIIVRRLLTKGDLIFVGPGTSIGSMYLGPLYYYMMAPALLIANFSPVGPAVMVALLGVATVFLLWLIARQWFPSAGSGQVEIPALIVAFLYAISTTAIIFSRSSWNPNIMPFFSLLSIYSIWKVYESRERGKWLVVLGISFAFVLQSHYLGLLLIPPIFIFWLLTLSSVRFKKESFRSFIKYSVIGFTIFFLLMSPLVAFDFKHGFRNFIGMKDFITGSKENYSPSFENTVSKILPMVRKVITRMIGNRGELIGLWSAALLLIGNFILIVKEGKKQIYLTLLWLFFGSLGLALLRQEIYDHYLGFLFPVPFLLLAAIIQGFLLQNRLKKLLLTLLVIILTFLTAVGFQKSNNPVMQLPRSIEIAKKISQEARGERFNLATISERNNRDVYQYFLEVWGDKVVDTDPLNTKFTITDQLFVVCERPIEMCDPVNDPSVWISHFGWSKIEDSWQVWGVNIFKLGHSEEWIKENRK